MAVVKIQGLKEGFVFEHNDTRIRAEKGNCLIHYEADADHLMLSIFACETFRIALSDDLTINETTSFADIETLADAIEVQVMHKT